ncbi:MAG: alpha/beta fold hydrolase [Thermoleophilaceae bacterium]
MDWTFGGLWPYEPRWFDTPEGRMHYVDEGPRDGRCVVLLHGNATWGFLYRNFISALVERGHRAIVPDHLGFGRSDKPSEPGPYRLDLHIRRLDALLESLDLRNATVVFAEWGAAIGLGWVTAHPDRVGRLLVLNSPYPERPAGKVRLPPPIYLFRAPLIGTLVVKGLGAFTKGFLFNASMVHKERLTRELKRAYLAPHRNWKSRTGVLAFPRQIPRGPDDLASRLGEEAQRGLAPFRRRPVRIMWAMRDVSFSEDVLDQWTALLPNATVTRIEDAGHCLQEDAHERIVPELLDLVSHDVGGAPE